MTFIMTPYIVNFILIAGIGNLTDVLKELCSVQARYHDIGLTLGVMPGDLEGFEYDTPTPLKAMERIISHWLKQNCDEKKFGKPSWRSLVEAVGHSLGGHNTALAKQMAKNHPRKGIKSTIKMQCQSS